jgi:predicted component of type VI protein secretion system
MEHKLVFMSVEEQDALVGRVIRELKVAEGELQQLLVRAEQVAADIQKLSKEVSDRVVRAKKAGTSISYQVSVQGLPTFHSDAGIEVGRLSSYSKAVDLEALDALDREIGIAVAKVVKLRQQRAGLDI